MSDITTLMMGAAGVSAGGINPREHFNTVLYTGNGTSQVISNVGFDTDFVWVKERSGTAGHRLFDQVRGDYEFLESNSTSKETFNSNQISFSSGGFTTGSSVNTNSNNDTYVAWNWNAGGSNATNTDGTITSTVRANPTAGFSIVTYTGTGSAATIGHGLGTAPSVLIVKELDNADQWHCGFAALGFTQYIHLDLANAKAASSAVFNDTAPTSSVFSVGTSVGTNRNNGRMLAYCFAEVEGFSKFGSYTGNGSATGPSVTTDFQPTWLMIKRTNTTGDWILLDSTRDASNPRTAYLEPNNSDAEATGNDVDFNSTGFQLKSTSASVNANGGTYIYACFA